MLDEQNENLSIEEASHRKLSLTKSLFATLESLPVQGYSSIVSLVDQIIKLNPASTETAINFLAKKLEDRDLTGYGLISLMIQMIHKHNPERLPALAPILLEKLAHERIDDCFRLSRRLIALDQNMLSDVVDRCLRFLSLKNKMHSPFINRISASVSYFEDPYISFLNGFSQLAEDPENEKRGVTQSREKTAIIFLNVLQNKIRPSSVKEAILYAEKIIDYDSSMQDFEVTP